MMMPFTMESGAKGGSMRQKMVIDSIETNVSLADSLFLMPAGTKPATAMENNKAAAKDAAKGGAKGEAKADASAGKDDAAMKTAVAGADSSATTATTATKPTKATKTAKAKKP